MHRPIDRRTILRALGWGGMGGGVMSLAAGCSGSETLEPGRTTTTPVKSPASGSRRLNFLRLPLADGLVIHAGSTAMDLYHAHPHIKAEEDVQPTDIRLQTRLTMRNHKEILDWLGLGWRNVVKLTRYQKQMSESKEIEEVLSDYFRDSWPAMTTVEVSVLSSERARLEIDLWVVPDPARVTLG